jgi:fatty-acyl-CoA synthase
VRDPESGRVMPVGETGELEFKGPSLMVGYDGNPEATAAAFTEDGFLRSGDLGYLTEDGGFVFLSRMGDVLRLAGFLVSPREIEAYLEQHPDVEGVQVVGVTTAKGPRAFAFVVARAGATVEEADLAAYCRRGLANYKLPVRFAAIGEFPVTPSANGFKIQRNKLRDMAQEIVASAESVAS